MKNIGNAHQSRRFVTLIELMIVMALIAVIMGVVGFNVVKMRRDQQFRSAVTVVQQKLQTALETMLIHNDTVRVVLQQEERGLNINLKTDTPFTKGLGRLLNRDPLIKGIDSFSWAPAEGEVYRGPTTLEFSSIARAIPKGTLTLFGPDSLKRTIVLNGYPHPFKATLDDEYQELDLDSEKEYPRGVRDMWEAAHEAGR